MEPSEAYVSLGNQLLKLFKSLSPDQADAIANGSAKLAFVPAGGKVVESSPAVELALKAVQRLSNEERATLGQPGSPTLALVPIGCRVVESSPAVELALKAVQRLSNEERATLGQPGSPTLALVPVGGRVLESSPALDLAVKAAQRLNDREIERLGQPGSAFKPVYKGGRVVYPVDISQVVSDVSNLDTEDEIIKFLDADDRLKPADLKKIAKELGIDLPTSAKDRVIIGAHIARSLAAYGMR